MFFIEYLMAGLLGGLLLVVAAKGIMAKLLQRQTDYYEKNYYEGGGDCND